MTGKINDGDVVVVEPLGDRALRVGDIVLLRVRGREYLHLVKAVQGDRCLVGNNCGGVNGWVGRQAVAGVATEIAPARR